MSKQSQRHANARMIRAAAQQGPIVLDSVGIDWINAADDGDKSKPKRFSMTAYTGGPMNVSSYGPPVVIDLSGMTAKAPIPILRDHDLGRVVGHADTVEIGDSSLKLAGIVSGAGPDAAEVLGSSANGFPWRASVGARSDKLELVGEGVTTKVNGKTLTGPLYVARKSTLGEVSFVALGADRKATATVAAVAADLNQEKKDMNFQQWIEAMGLDLAELRDDQKAKLQAKYDAEVKAIQAAAKKAGEAINAAAPPVVAPTFDLSGIALAYESHLAVVEAAAEEYRGKVPEADYAKIMAAARKGAIEAKAAALKEAWATPRLEAEYIKAAAMVKADLMVAERPKGPAIHASTRDLTSTVIEAAMAQTLNLPGIEAQYDAATMQAAHTQFRGRVGLQQLLMIAASANGYQCMPGERIHNGNCREVLRHALQASASTISLPGLMSNVANKELLAGFNEVDQTWRRIATIKNVSDFKAVTSYRMLDDFTYEKLPADGHMKHGQLGEESFTRQADTYAKMFALTRKDIINDDLGAFDDIRNRLGRGAARKFLDVFWAEFINNSSFFTAARGNYISGATTTLLTDFVGLALAIKAFDDLKSTAVPPATKGKRLGGKASMLLVPPELDAIARAIFKDVAATKASEVNIYSGQFEPVKVTQLSDSSFTGYSTTAWYLLRNPSDYAGMVVSFLNGAQAPTVESADADFDQLGIQFRGYHDFGCDQAEWVCGVKSKGAA